LEEIPIASWKSLKSVAGTPWAQHGENGDSRKAKQRHRFARLETRLDDPKLRLRRSMPTPGHDQLDALTILDISPCRLAGIGVIT
jgi:hypothetical protein